MDDAGSIVGLPSMQLGSDVNIDYDTGGPNGGFHFGGEFDWGFQIAPDHYLGPSVGFSAGLTGPEFQLRADA